MTNIRLVQQDELTPVFDASGRLRSSQLITLGEYKANHDHSYLFSTAVLNGSVTYDDVDSQYTLQLTGSSAGDYAIMQTRASHSYFNGKSQIIEITFDDWTDETNVDKMAGYYSSSIVAPFTATKDGIWIVNSSGTLRIDIYRAGVLTASIPRSQWMDPLDGTGPSGLTLDTSKFLVFAIDFLHLGGTSMRLMTRIGGKWILAHRYDHSNYATGTFIKHPSQPLRLEIRATGAYTGTPTFNFHCAAVSTEGAINTVTETRLVHMGTGTVNANTDGVWYALKGVRLKLADRNKVIVPKQVSVQALTGDNFLWALFINPTVSGTFNFTDVPFSHMQEATGDTVGNPSATTVTGTRIVEGKYGAGSATVSVMLDDAIDRIGCAIDGTLDTLVLAVMPMTSNLDIRGALVVTSFT